MTWLVKEFSKLTKISVRALHHYDEIGLLKPSLRTASNYRVYSQADLLKLERIVALKFFGYSLTQIRALVENSDDLAQHLRSQQKELAQRMEQLRRADELITGLLGRQSAKEAVDWSEVIKLIEGFHMIQDLKKTWAGEVYNDNELTQFAQLRQKYSDKEMTDYAKRWEILIDKVKKYMATNSDATTSEAGALAREWMALVDEVYGQYPDLKKALSDAYKQSKIPGAPLDAQLYDFIERASKHISKH